MRLLDALDKHFGPNGVGIAYHFIELSEVVERLATFDVKLKCPFAIFGRIKLKYAQPNLAEVRVGYPNGLMHHGKNKAATRVPG